MSRIFDRLSPLKDDPEAFEKERRKILEEHRSSLSSDQRQRAEQSQWVIDGELRKHKDPQERLNKMVEMFWKGVLEFRDTIRGG